MKSKKDSLLSSEGNWTHSPEMANSIVKGLKRVTEQTGKHKQIARLAKFTDMSYAKLSVAIDKMSDRDKRDMLKAAADINRVVREIQKSELSNVNNTRSKPSITVLQSSDNVSSIFNTDD